MKTKSKVLKKPTFQELHQYLLCQLHFLGISPYNLMASTHQQDERMSKKKYIYI